MKFRFLKTDIQQSHYLVDKQASKQVLAICGVSSTRRNTRDKATYYVMHGRSKDPETDSTSCNTSFKAPQRTDLHHPPAQNMETSRLIDEDGETVDKSANIITVSEVSDHDDITRRGSLHRKSKTEDKTTASDGIQAPCVVPQRKGKVIIHCLRHAQVRSYSKMHNYIIR